MNQNVLKDLMSNLSGVLSPVYYLKSLGWRPFKWQEHAIQKHYRLVLNCCRQAGKSTVVSAKAIHRAKYYPNSLILLISPSERQSVELMNKVEAFMSCDPQLPRLATDNKLEKEFINKSRILALPGSEKTTRGFSEPAMVIIDEASRVEEELYYSLLPMMEDPEAELILMSTPHGKRGFFFDAWNSVHWSKVEVTGRDILKRFRSEKQYMAIREKDGIWACYSPRHTEKSLKMKYDLMGDWWYRQEYCGEFVDSEDSVFNTDDIMAAITDSVKPLMGKHDVYSDEVEVINI